MKHNTIPNRILLEEFVTLDGIHVQLNKTWLGTPRHPAKVVFLSCRKTPYSDGRVTTRVMATLKGAGKVLLFVENACLDDYLDQIKLYNPIEHNCTCSKCGKEWGLKTAETDETKLSTVKQTCPECQVNVLLAIPYEPQGEL